MLKKICVCGHFAFGRELSNGQTIKTKMITTELESHFGNSDVVKIDTHGGIGRAVSLPFRILNGMRQCENIVIFPAHKGLQVITPCCLFGRLFYKRTLHYVVIGGWLPEFLKKKKRLSRLLKKFDRIYVETKGMKSALEEQGFGNVCVMPNCKNLKILQKSELVYPTSEPYKLCTFSRVMKEKGIENAIEAVRRVNDGFGRTVFTLDIYGQVDEGQRGWFDGIRADFPDSVRYRGVVPFDRSVETLKDYFALLFPTRYAGEGFAGTLIDAMAAGVPVVASDWKYNGEVVIHGQTGVILQDYDAEKLIDQLKSMKENPTAWNSMKETTLDEAGKYTPRAVVQALLNHIDS